MAELGTKPAWLPSLISVDGDYLDMLNRLYLVFYADFIRNQTCWRECPVLFDKRKIDSPYEEGFWHIVTRTDRGSGDRFLDSFRAERLPWCSATIRNDPAPEIRSFQHPEGSGRIRTYVWLEEFDYVVILEPERTGRRVRLVTAYHVDGPSGRRQLTKKWERRCG